MTTTTTITASPAKLKNGSWGARVRGDVTEGDTITITTRGGKSWDARVTKVVWSGEGVAVCATESLAGDAAAAERRATMTEEDLKAEVERVAAKFVGRKLTPQTRRAIKGEVVSIVAAAMDDDDPVPIYVAIDDADPNRITIESPRYEHDCHHCVFLGRFEEWDLWAHPVVPKTIIARRSSDPADYVSGLQLRNELPALAECYRRASEAGMRW
jgi:hypothetical protein